MSKLYANYNVKNVIPGAWVQRFKCSSVEKISRWPDVIILNIGSKLVNIEKIRTKDVYTELINKKVKLLTALNVWINLFPFLENHEWQQTFVVPFRISTLYQSFEYKTLNRILNRRENCHKWKLIDDPSCLTWTIIDTIENYLYYCSE